MIEDRKSASRGPNEPEIVFSGHPERDIVEICDFWGPQRAKMVTFDTFSDLNHPLDGFRTSDLVRSGQDTFPDGVEGLIYGHGSYINHCDFTPGTPEKHPFELILASGDTFSGLNHLLGGVKTSYLVQSGQALWTGREGPRSDKSR